jgi:hypothetical protein
MQALLCRLSDSLQVQPLKKAIKQIVTINTIQNIAFTVTHLLLVLQSILATPNID